MKRGIKIYNSISDTETVNTVGKGRNGKLIIQRDRLLTHRYYYYAKIRQLKYELVISAIATEFHLSQRRVIDIVISSSDLIRELKQKDITISVLKKEYPHFNWNL